MALAPGLCVMEGGRGDLGLGMGGTQSWEISMLLLLAVCWGNPLLEGLAPEGEEP